MADSPFQHFGGMVPPMVTPLLEPDALDLGGLERLIEHLIRGGVSGLFALGTTGEGPNLSHRLRHEMVNHTLRLTRGRVPVLVGITDTSFTESVELARVAASAGAEAVVVAPPYYYPMGQAELASCVERLAAKQDLPLFLYNIPVMTGTAFALPTVQRLMETDSIVGIKDSSGDMIYLQRLLQMGRARPDWRIFVGPEELTAEGVLHGAHGGVSGGANIAPQLFVDLVRAAMSEDLLQVRTLQARVLELGAAVYRIGSDPCSSYLRGVKGALSLLGICNDCPAEPFQSFSEIERELLRERLAGLGLTG